MPTLHVRDVPDALHRRLRALAGTGRRSVRAEVIALLEEAVARREAAEPVEAVLARLRARRDAIRLPKDWPGSVALLRADRRR